MYVCACVFESRIVACVGAIENEKWNACGECASATQLCGLFSFFVRVRKMEYAFGVMINNVNSMYAHNINIKQQDVC